MCSSWHVAACWILRLYIHISTLTGIKVSLSCFLVISFVVLFCVISLTVFNVTNWMINYDDRIIIKSILKLNTSATDNYKIWKKVMDKEQWWGYSSFCGIYYFKTEGSYVNDKNCNCLTISINNTNVKKLTEIVMNDHWLLGRSRITELEKRNCKIDFDKKKLNVRKISDKILVMVILVIGIGNEWWLVCHYGPDTRCKNLHWKSPVSETKIGLVKIIDQNHVYLFYVRGISHDKCICVEQTANVTVHIYA